MSGYGTIKIPEPAYEHHNERRQDLGLTWEQYINNQAPEKQDMEELTQEIKKLQELVEQAPKRTAEELEYR